MKTEAELATPMEEAWPDEARAEDEDATAARAAALRQQHLDRIYTSTSWNFAVLALLEWAAAVAAAVWISPRTWAGQVSATHPHVWIALILGGAITSLPVALAVLQPRGALTRHLVAASQMLMAGLLVHMTGGRIETHFAYFGLLSFLAFYRDWKVLVTATLVAGADHAVRAAMWPESMYGVSAVQLWRPLEHAAWVLFEVGFLIDFIAKTHKSILASALRQARLERVRARIASEVRERTAELAESEKRYRVMFENSPLPMWLCDARTMMFLEVNQQAVRRYGYSRDEFLKMHSFEIRPPEDIAAFQKFLAAMPDGETPLRQWRHRRKDGTLMDVEVTSHPVDWSGRRALLVISNDITDRKRAEREREELEVQLRHAQKLESIGQLAAGIAHEINTPTQYIGDNLHFLRDAFTDMRAVVETQERVLPQLRQNESLRAAAAELQGAIDSADAPYLMEEIPKALDQALDGVSRVSTLVAAMKEFSHPGRREKQNANLNEAIRSTVTVARNEWKYVAEMDMDFDPQLPLVPCMVSDFNQVVLNLIVNAAHAIQAAREAAKAGGAVGTSDVPLGRIAIRTRGVAEPGGRCVEIRIEDTGTGIPEEVRARVFDPFFTTKDVGKGTGQGLAIARSVIVDKHGGTIRFETETGKRTAFIIRLPVDLPACEPESADLAMAETQ